MNPRIMMIKLLENEGIKMASRLAAVPILGTTPGLLLAAAMSANSPLSITLGTWAYTGVVLGGALQTLSTGNPIFLVPSIPIYYIIIDNYKKR